MSASPAAVTYATWALGSVDAGEAARKMPVILAAKMHCRRDHGCDDGCGAVHRCRCAAARLASRGFVLVGSCLWASVRRSLAADLITQLLFCRADNVMRTSVISS